MTENPNILSIASIIIAVVGTVLVPILIPITSWGVRKFTLWCEFRKFKNMINENYIESIDEKIDKEDYLSLTTVASDTVKRVEYLSSELAYLESGNQFEMIRYVEYIKSYCKVISRISKLYTLPQNIKEEEKIKKKKVEEIREIFDVTKKDYIKLKRDKLLTNEEKYIRDTQTELNNIPKS